MPADIALVWLRRTLRLADNPSLRAALSRHEAAVPVYVDDSGGRWDPGSAARAWLAASLSALDGSLAERGSRLTVLAGPAAVALPALAAALGARAVYADRSYVAEIARRDEEVARSLEGAGARLVTLDCSLLRPPDAPMTAAERPYTVFTPYFTACRKLAPPGPPLPAPGSMPLPPGVPAGLASLSVAAGDAPPRMAEYFTPGEAGAHRALDRFLAEAIADYDTGRDLPDRPGTSRLSAHLAFGELSPGAVLAAVEEHLAGASREPASLPDTGALAFVRQLYWREFAGYLLHHFPHTATRPLRPEFDAMPWAEDPAGLAAWRDGLTGYPIVDAGMRELAATGWMHNRVRMLAASLLTKDLLVPWQTGERCFWERLVDADAGSNTLGWQWVAGSGADAAPYFRVFNPTVQGERFDPDGSYVRTWVPELAAVPARFIHRPWEAPSEVLAAAGVSLGGTYPLPIIDHAEARTRALGAYAVVRPGRR
jgi:deoxyribodipyrimidine photo-lyase